ncbi:MAG: hypothetical protein KDD35_06810 [Bdellovibrionales bacterium]|nr:hypothetical protein [Bdellovibrionales bacterium]
MDLLRRYQKPGGFLQLVQLIETCMPQKQHQLLTSIEKESPIWAETVRNKILSIDRIFSWDEQTLAELVSRIQELTLSIAVHGIAPDIWARATKSLGHGQLRRIDDLSKTKDPSPGEIATAFTKIIVEIREMISLGYIHLAKVDPGLVIENDIEEKLGKGGMAANGLQNSSSSNSNSVSSTSSHPMGDTHSNTKGASQDSNLEVSRLRRENMELKKELQAMSNEINQMRTVIAQIKRAVA